MTNRTIPNGVKQYIQNIFRTVKMIDNSLIECADEDYYKQLLKYIKDYTKTHKLYMAYELQKMSFNNVKHILGISERRTYRYLEDQRKKFITFIEEKETKLLGE